MSGMGAFPRRKQNREPLLTATEMARELGMPLNTMRNYMRYRNGPKPELVSVGSGTTKAYYKPSEVRRWWAQVKETL